MVNKNNFSVESEVADVERKIIIGEYIEDAEHEKVYESGSGEIVCSGRKYKLIKEIVSLNKKINYETVLFKD